MRRFLTALIVLSILVMAQNVVALVPAPDGQEWPLAVVDLGSKQAAESEPAHEMPYAMSMLLLLAGVSGLTIAGGRPARERRPTDP